MPPPRGYEPFVHTSGPSKSQRRWHGFEDKAVDARVRINMIVLILINFRLDRMGSITR